MIKEYCDLCGREAKGGKVEIEGKISDLTIRISIAISRENYGDFFACRECLVKHVPGIVESVKKHPDFLDYNRYTVYKI